MCNNVCIYIYIHVHINMYAVYTKFSNQCFLAVDLQILIEYRDIT